LKLIDASVAAKFALAEEGADLARNFIGQPLQAPTLLLSETANAWWKAWRRGVLERDSYGEAVSSLPGVFDRLLDVESVIVRAAELSAELMHPVYDCIYLAWAEKLEQPLVTADERLLNRLLGTPFESLCERLS
jgi:predicted nucleic acid-binding protein